MKITKNELRSIIKEELQGPLNEKTHIPYAIINSGRYEIRKVSAGKYGNVILNDTYSLYIDGKQIGPNVIGKGGITVGADFEKVLRKLIKT